MMLIAIDGACRRNGKPSCVAAGGVFIKYPEGRTAALSNYEVGSTNQRGELLALLTALDHIWSAKMNALVVTDSEYLFNAMTKEWFNSWSNRGWLTANGEPVKNKNLWVELMNAYKRCLNDNIDIVFYHIKGHCIPFGKVTANSLLSNDPDGAQLLIDVYRKYDIVIPTKPNIVDDALDLSEKNNGFKFSPETLRDFVCMNIVADSIATKCVDAADALL